MCHQDNLLNYSGLSFCMSMCLHIGFTVHFTSMEPKCSHYHNYFSADNSFKDFMDTYAIITYDGQVLWMFPAVSKTYCTLDVRHFPFDRQKCKIIFISWTFNGFKVSHLLTTCNATHNSVTCYLFIYLFIY